MRADALRHAHANLRRGKALLRAEVNAALLGQLFHAMHAVVVNQHHALQLTLPDQQHVVQTDVQMQKALIVQNGKRHKQLAHAHKKLQQRLRRAAFQLLFQTVPAGIIQKRIQRLVQRVRVQVSANLIRMLRQHLKVDAVAPFKAAAVQLPYLVSLTVAANALLLVAPDVPARLIGEQLLNQHPVHEMLVYGIAVLSLIYNGV